MISTGQYQNEIASLSTLNQKDYERVFKIFKQSVDDKDFYVYNILRKVEFPEVDSRYIDYHEVSTRTAMTIVSYQIYGDIKSWWIIYLLNKDKFNGAPFYVESGTQLKFIKDELRSAIYTDITQSTVFAGRHY